MFTVKFFRYAVSFMNMGYVPLKTSKNTKTPTFHDDKSNAP